MADDRRRSGLPEAGAEMSDALRAPKLPKPKDAMPEASRASELLKHRPPTPDALGGSELAKGEGALSGALSGASHSELLQRSKGLQARAAELHQRLYDPQAKKFIQTFMAHHLVHADRFLAADATSRPSGICETVWLDSAETMLRSTEQSFSTFEKVVKQYFGQVEGVKLVR